MASGVFTAEEELVEMAMRRGMLHFAQYYAGALIGILLIILSMMQMRVLLDETPFLNPLAPWFLLVAATPLILFIYIPGILSTSTLNYSYLYVFALAACSAALTTSVAPSERLVTWGQLGSLVLLRIFYFWPYFLVPFGDYFYFF